MRPAVSNAKIALDETMPSEPATAARSRSTRRRPSNAEIASYKTHAGSLLGTPLYMAPEQIAGALPDERSEVFSVGVLAYEILAGKPPYTATSMDALFRQITKRPAAAARRRSPSRSSTIVARALAKDPAARWPTMAALRDAIAAERKRRFAPPARRWPLAVAALVLVAGAGVGLYAWRAHAASAPRGRATSTSSARSTSTTCSTTTRRCPRCAPRSRVAPDHPRANAYMILFGGAPRRDRTTAVDAARRARPRLRARQQGPRAARRRDRARRARRGEGRARSSRTGAAAIASSRSGPPSSTTAPATTRPRATSTRRCSPSPTTQLRGRIYDHYSSVLLYFDEPTEALRIGTLYRDAFPGEADAVAVYATTLAAAGKYPEAVAAAEEALRLAEGEDTLAGLAKVLALRGDRARAKELYDARSSAPVPRAARSAAPRSRFCSGSTEITGRARDRRAVSARRRRCRRSRARSRACSSPA